MAPTLETFGLLTIVTGGGQTVTRQVQIIGVRPEQRASTGDFAEYLVDDRFDRAKDAYGKIPPSFRVDPRLRLNSSAGHLLREMTDDDPLKTAFEQQALEQVPDQGTIVGFALATVHRAETKSDLFIAPRGTKAVLTFPTAGRQPKAMQDSFTVVGYFKSGMSEYDSTHVYVPLERLQYLRGLDEGPGRGAVNQIQIKTKPGVDIDALAATLQDALEPMRPMYFRVSTWEQKQGPLLAAVAVEQGILNLLLFFIIAVAGFGILAIFSMIVVEKTRDIGILKALGASTAGVRGIFLGYGLSLGLVGSGVGMAGGLLFVRYINAIEAGLSRLTGRKVFDDSIYYFDHIPTRVEPLTVLGIVGGALLIAVAASVWPAQRAARLHPVRALRFE
jgi:lipoprotein-releasing system permease protein